MSGRRKPPAEPPPPGAKKQRQHVWFAPARDTRRAVFSLLDELASEGDWKRVAHLARMFGLADATADLMPTALRNASLRDDEGVDGRLASAYESGALRIDALLAVGRDDPSPTDAAASLGASVLTYAARTANDDTCMRMVSEVPTADLLPILNRLFVDRAPLPLGALQAVVASLPSNALVVSAPSPLPSAERALLITALMATDLGDDGLAMVAFRKACGVRPNGVVARHRELVLELAASSPTIAQALHEAEGTSPLVPRILKLAFDCTLPKTALDLWHAHFGWEFFEPARRLVVGSHRDQVAELLDVDPDRIEARLTELEPGMECASVGFVVAETDYGSLLDSSSPGPCVAAAVVDPSTGDSYCEAIDLAGDTWSRAAKTTSSASAVASALLERVLEVGGTAVTDESWGWRWAAYGGGL